MCAHRKPMIFLSYKTVRYQTIHPVRPTEIPQHNNTDITLRIFAAAVIHVTFLVMMIKAIEMLYI